MTKRKGATWIEALGDSKVHEEPKKTVEESPVATVLEGPEKQRKESTKRVGRVGIERPNVEPVQNNLRIPWILDAAMAVEINDEKRKGYRRTKVAIVTEALHDYFEKRGVNLEELETALLDNRSTK